MKQMADSLNGVLHIPHLARSLPTKWNWRRLDDVCIGVFDCPHSTPILTADGPFVVRTQDVITGTFRADQAARVSEETYEDRIRRAEPTFGDLLFSREGTYFGIAAEVPSNTRVCLGQRMVLLRPKANTLDPRFLKYWLNSPILAGHVQGHRDGTVAERLNMPTIRALPVPIAPLHEQRRIGAILGTLDDKIELNRRMNDTLEAMARRLFKSWFVDFDPVHAKAALRRQHPKLSNADLSRRALPHMAPEIAELFPDTFEESTLGPIPKGWKAGAIGDLTLLDKSSVNPCIFPNEVFDHYSIPAFDDGKNPVRETGDQIKSNKFVVTDDCVLLTKLNPRIPRVWLPFPSTSRRSLCSTEFLVLKPKDGVPREFLFSLTSSGAFFEVYETMVTGTSGSHQRIRPEHLLNMNIVIPAEPLQACFAEVVCNQFKHSDALQRGSRNLATTRDRLLPRLLSGELSA